MDKSWCSSGQWENKGISKVDQNIVGKRYLFILSVESIYITFKLILSNGHWIVCLIFFYIYVFLIKKNKKMGVGELTDKNKYINKK